ncbi:Phenylalanine-tRNA ligase, chloroplastic/mitochondrial [Auxenochlorella protothecoides]|uniref:phenylalanine--tRNA ligase n=1 Tax=Auxenochlorella protothecoides TaxID=3075 RepID=A0A087SRT2_AUXPR|nr:Phenylalanine-tRNA ligase, chloroplastic/mitochondrial [Auxenochlorella protothecoides]KFM28436.1 Phenylalanine-tRNA ligase, chloroplastic/mitochondrial [Auxenochlorella protothecoides]
MAGCCTFRYGTVAALTRSLRVGEQCVRMFEGYRLPKYVCSIIRATPQRSISALGVLRDQEWPVPPFGTHASSPPLARRPSHPLGIIKTSIYEYLQKADPALKTFDDLYPVVTVKANFDDVLVPADHVSRNPNDTYYVSDATVLRCHTSAHQLELLKRGEPAFLITGDVYRRDSIDSTHYPVFHQMEGLRVLGPEDWGSMEPTQYAETQLKQTLEGLAQHLFGSVEMRWVDAYFPFTEPSFELEILFKGEWLEVLGCGVTQQSIVDDGGFAGRKAWAFGLGLERLAMVLFDIPDIRLFWTEDSRFLSQFKAGSMKTKFKPYSKYPPCFKDVAFWLSDSFTENNLCEVVRAVAGDLVEEVKLIDSFTHPKTGKTSHCYRIAYRSMQRSLTDEEINELQWTVRRDIENQLKVELR